MFSVYEPWDSRADHTQRSGYDKRTALIIMDTRRRLFNFGWRPNVCGIRMSKAGACVPIVLPFDDDCKHLVIMDMKNVNTILSRANQGDTKFDYLFL